MRYSTSALKFYALQYKCTQILKEVEALHFLVAR